MVEYAILAWANPRTRATVRAATMTAATQRPQWRTGTTRTAPAGAAAMAGRGPGSCGGALLTRMSLSSGPDDQDPPLIAVVVREPWVTFHFCRIFWYVPSAISAFRAA